MLRIRYLFIPVVLLVFVSWVIHAYRSSVLDADFLLYGQSVTVGGTSAGRGSVNNPSPIPADVGHTQYAITLERTTCFGACPAYLLQIDPSGAVSFRQGPPANRREERTSTITVDQFHNLVAGFAAIHFFDLNDVYPETSSDLPTVHIGLTLEGKTKTITHSDVPPPGLEELERTIERTTNIHRWLHGDPDRFSLQSPVAGAFSRGGEDLKNEDYVRRDVYARIKPGMTPLMQIAGGWGIETRAQGQAARRRMQRVTASDQARWTADELRQALERGDDVNAADETGWTPLMIAAVTVQPQSISILLDSGAYVDQRDHHGDTALIGAASVRFNNLQMAAEVLGILLAHGASVEATNDLGESALMWSARAGNPESIKVLLKAGANPARVDRSGHDALFYLRNARDNLTFDRPLVERYNRAESALNQR
ncbi:MAG: hypothetical protein DMG15_25285 [Acidobacteria bacterium]|nr:MAG: hypothetical protein DMG15_25285 [Acidobacteriota bacterium]